MNKIDRDLWASHSLQAAGYDTVWSYFARENPEAMALLSDPESDLESDSQELSLIVDEELIIRVPSPRGFRNKGTVDAFPSSALATHFN